MRIWIVLRRDGIRAVLSNWQSGVTHAYLVLDVSRNGVSIADLSLYTSSGWRSELQSFCGLVIIISHTKAFS
jgi:hypothetical protein